MSLSTFRSKKTVHLILFILGSILVTLGLAFLGLAFVPSQLSGRAFLIFVFFLFLIAPGGLLLCPYILDIRLTNLYRQYMPLIAQYGITNVNEISKRINVPADVVFKDIQRLLQKDLISLKQEAPPPRQAPIPQYRPNAAVHAQAQSVPASPAPAAAYKKKQKYVRCSNCAADKLITIGEPERCDYCGSPLDSDE